MEFDSKTYLYYYLLEKGISNENANKIINLLGNIKIKLGSFRYNVLNHTLHCDDIELIDRPMIVKTMKIDLKGNIELLCTYDDVDTFRIVYSFDKENDLKLNQLVYLNNQKGLYVMNSIVNNKDEEESYFEHYDTLALNYLEEIYNLKEEEIVNFTLDDLSVINVKSDYNCSNFNKNCLGYEIISGLSQKALIDIMNYELKIKVKEK